jgi:AraC family transcriptional regulator
MAILVVAEKDFHELYRSLPLKEEIVKACTPANALDFVRQYQADLILLDCGFEVERGLRLLKEVKTLCPDVPIVFLTDDRTGDSAEKALRGGAREFIVKPANIFVLQNTIKDLLKIKRSSKEKRFPFIPSRVPVKPVKTITTDNPAFILRAVRYIEKNLAEKISLDMIAKTANLSKYHFCRLFFRHTGMTPLKFTTFMRMQRAKELLKREDLTVSIIATQVGFNDLGSFIRQFKKHIGVTPGIYRNSLRKA